MRLIGLTLAALAVFAVALAAPTAPKAPNYPTSLLLTMCEYAAAAYCPQTLLENWSCSRCGYGNYSATAGFQPVQIVEDVKDNLQAYVGVSDSLPGIVVAFRGTQETSLKNWITDLYSAHSDFNYPGCTNGCKVHEGFYNAYNRTVQAGLLTAIQQAQKMRPSYTLYVTGHSLGAALATLCASDMVSNYGFEGKTVLTNYGSPRVGDTAYYSWVKTILPMADRVVNQADIVPHLPPEDFNFHHIATEMWINPVGVITQCNGSGEDPNCSDSVPVYDFSIADHLDYFGLDMGTGPCTPP